MDPSITVEGSVTNLNENLLTFEINNITTVHMVLMFPECLPSKGTKVKVSSPFFNGSSFFTRTLVLSPFESQIEGNLSVRPVLNTFVQLVKELDLTAADLLDFAKNYGNLKKFKLLHQVSVEDIMFSLLQKLRLAKFELLFVSNMHFFDQNPESYKEYAYWTFGTHWNWSWQKPKYLFGYLYASKKTSMVYFTDFKDKLSCLIKPSPALINCYVVIKDYTIITEIYNCEKFRSLKYLIVDPNKIIKLNVIEPKEIFPSEATLIQDNNYNKASCRILSKSMSTANSAVDIVNWLEIIQDEKLRSFLCLKSPCAEVSPFLQPGHTYRVYFTTPPQRVVNKAISMVDESLLQDETSNMFFIPTDSPAACPNILNLVDANTKLQTSCDLISFEGVISRKRFVKPISSQAVPVTDDISFGTPGVKTHVLVFQSSGTSLSLYLNNWENMAAPYGLVPNMRVIAYNVKAQKSQYFESTAMTSFEIVSYEPKFKIETANLYDVKCGLRDFLGAEQDIPNGTIIWCKVLFVTVLSLKIRNKDYPTPASDFDVTITLKVLDQMGESKVIAVGKAAKVLLRVLFRMPQCLYQRWANGLLLLNGFSYSKGVPLPEEPADRGHFVKKIMTSHLKNFENYLCPMELTCQKVDYVDGLPIYFLMDANF